MATQIFVGAGQGGCVRRSIDEDRWQKVEGGLPADAEVRAIEFHPRDPQVIYLGTQHGPYKSTDGGKTFKGFPFPDPGMTVWTFLFDPSNPQRMYAGTAPEAIYQSENGGETWKRLTGLKAPRRVKMSFPTRVIKLALDPSNPRELYAGLEVDGLMRSLDGGTTWEDCSPELVKLAERPHLKSRIVSDTDIEGMMDSHSLCLSSAQPGTVFLALRMGLFRSPDRGKTWEDMEVGRFSPLTYARDVQVSPHDPRTLFACLSPAARSEDGSLYRSNDLGATWHRIDRGVRAKSTMMNMALHAKDPDQIYCATRFGQVFGTRDGGKTWSEHQTPAGVTDVYAVACA